MATHSGLTIGTSSDVGKRRELNEDTIGIPTMFGVGVEELLSRGVLVAVADGMGGHAAGEVASRAAIESLFKTFYGGEAAEPQAALQAAFAQANQAVFELASSDPGKKNMGTTLVAALIKGMLLHIANVGDSRAYLVRGRQVRQVSLDHSLVEEQVRAGILTEEQARSSLHKNIITRAIGLGRQVQVDTFTEDLESNDRILLCSDGLSNKLDSADILRMMTADTDPEHIAHSLTDLANQRGGEDNISAVVVHLPPGRPAAFGAVELHY